VNREDAAEGLRALTASVSQDEGIEQLGDLWVTRHGIVFPTGSTDEKIERVVDALGEGEVPT
jgi:hypothetical protein